MTTVAYIANEFPSPIEPYVMDEIGELRTPWCPRDLLQRKESAAQEDLSPAERGFREESFAFHPLPLVGGLASDALPAREVRRHVAPLLAPSWCRENGRSGAQRLHLVGHTILGAALADELAASRCGAHPCASRIFCFVDGAGRRRLLGIGFSFTLHGSDLLLGKADLLAAKLEQCRFCVTVSNFNRDYILRQYPSTPASKIDGAAAGSGSVL